MCEDFFACKDDVLLNEIELPSDAGQVIITTSVFVEKVIRLAHYSHIAITESKPARLGVCDL